MKSTKNEISEIVKKFSLLQCSKKDNPLDPMNCYHIPDTSPISKCSECLMQWSSFRKQVIV